jgi:hypothetical protein
MCTRRTVLWLPLVTLAMLIVLSGQECLPKPNGWPIANAGPDQTKCPGEQVFLDFTASSDLDGDSLTYLSVKIRGPADIVLDGANTATPSFLPPMEGEYEISLTVKDRRGATDEDTVVIHVSSENCPPPCIYPEARARTDKPEICGGQSGNLIGSGSVSDPPCPITDRSWRQTGGPAVDIANPYTADTTFVAPMVNQDTQLTFVLTVSNDTHSNTDTLVITIICCGPGCCPQPVASAGPDQTVNEKTTVTLDGSGSYDPQDGQIALSWLQKAGLPVTLSNPTAAKPTFTAPEVGPGGAVFVFQLTMSKSCPNDTTLTATDEVTITVQDNCPLAVNAGPDKASSCGGSISLEATATCGTPPISFLWEAIAMGSSGTVNLSNASTQTPTATFSPDARGTFTFKVTATDSTNATASDTVNVLVACEQPSPSTMHLRSGGSLNGQSVDPEHRWILVPLSVLLSGTVETTIDSNNSPGAIVLRGYTLAPGCGWTLTPGREAQPVETESWVGPYEGDKSVPVSKAGFTDKGVYFLVFSYAGRYEFCQVMSGTHAGVLPCVWNDGNDLGWDWDVSHYHQAQQYGYVDINLWNGTTFEPYRQAADWVGIIAGDFSTLNLSSGGSLNSQPVDSSHYWIEVNAGEGIVGTVNVAVVCLNSPGAIVLMGYTATWGDRTTQPVQTHSWSGPKTATLSMNVDVTAPAVAGEYYLPISFAGRYNFDQVMSATHAGTAARYNDGNDIGWDWTATHRQQARDWGLVAQETLYPDGRMCYNPQAATWVGVRVR